MSAQAFSPVGATVTVAASTSSAATALPATYKDVVLYVVNPTNGVAFVNFAASSAVATTAGVPVPVGGSVKFTAKGPCGSVAVILATGATAGNVYVTPGEGI
jgi:hypothetical protein